VAEFVTFRRHYLDTVLASLPFRGDVLDVGGERRNRRGTFTPSGDDLRWRYLNPDSATQPDLCASAEKIPAENASFDAVVLTEVIEHLEEPEKALAECRRVLRPSGKLVATIPFLYGVHGDPQDFQRWTPERIQREVARAGFENIEIRPMGGIVAVVADLFEMYCQGRYERNEKPAFVLRAARRLMRAGLVRCLLKLDARSGFKDRITTGYFVSAIAR
jgi:SAM-dependent methyltransferase